MYDGNRMCHACLMPVTIQPIPGYPTYTWVSNLYLTLRDIHSLAHFRGTCLSQWSNLVRGDLVSAPPAFRRSFPLSPGFPKAYHGQILCPVTYSTQCFGEKVFLTFFNLKRKRAKSTCKWVASSGQRNFILRLFSSMYM